jgi:hypothetical protein
MTAMSATSVAPATPQERPVGSVGQAGISGSRVMAGLTTLFNFLVLNFVLVLVSIPLITLPAALNAASVALDHWREEGEDRVVREFLVVLRYGQPLRTTVRAGLPLAAIAIGVVELRYFAHRGSVADHLGLGLSLAALLITLTALGYVFQLMARHPSLSAAELWSLCAQLAAGNAFVTGPLFLAEICGAAALTLLDPSLLVLGVPILLLNFMRVTARFGLRRAELKGSS